MQVPIFAAPLLVMIGRIDAARESGGLIEGLKFDKKASTRNVETKDCPLVILRGVSSQGESRQGAVKAEQKVEGVINNVNGETMVIRLELNTRYDRGWVSEGYDGTTDAQPAINRGHLEWLAALLDAIETRSDGSVIDASLDLTCVEPVTFNCLEPEEGSTCIVSVIEVVCRTHPRCRAQRLTGYPGLG